MMSIIQQCGICGQALLSGDLTSDPSAHFCGLELNGAAIVQPGVVATEKVESTPLFVSDTWPRRANHQPTQIDSHTDTPDSRPSSSFSESGNHTTAAVAAVPRTSVHHPADLAEIGRLHMENEALKGNLPSTLSTPRYAPAVMVSLPTGEHVTKEVSLPDGESVLVEVAVHAK